VQLACLSGVSKCYSVYSFLSMDHTILTLPSSKGTTLPPLSPFETVKHLAEYVSNALARAKEATGGKTPKVMVMGAKGRCGQGAVEFLHLVGIEDASKWDLEETAKGGPFPEILDHDVFVNCIYLMGAIPPFLTKGTSSKDPAFSLNILSHYLTQL